MIQLRKSIKVGPTIVPAGTVLHNAFQSNVVYYKGTKILIDKIPNEAIYVPQGTDYDGSFVTCGSMESKCIGDKVQVRSISASRLGDMQIIAKGKLSNIGKFSKLRHQIASEDAVAYEHIAMHCKTGDELVWQLNGKWYCNDGVTALEDLDLQIVPSSTANTDNIMYNGVVVARIVSPSLAKAGYPDSGYLNSKKHQITVLNNDNQPIALKCIKDFTADDENDDKKSDDMSDEEDKSDDMSDDTSDDMSDDEEDSEVVMEQDILNELAPILQGNETLSADLSVDTVYYDDNAAVDMLWTPYELSMIKSVTDTLKQSFDKVTVLAVANKIFICIYDADKVIATCKFEHDKNFYWLDSDDLPEDIAKPKQAQHTEVLTIIRKVLDMLAPTYIEGTVARTAM